VWPASAAGTLSPCWLHRQTVNSNYVYIAPPQYKEMWSKVLQTLDANPGWLSEDAWVIAQIHPREYTALELQNLEEFDQRKYGSTLLVFYREAE